MVYGLDGRWMGDGWAMGDGVGWMLMGLLDDWVMGYGLQRVLGDEQWVVKCSLYDSWFLGLWVW